MEKLTIIDWDDHCGYEKGNWIYKRDIDNKPVRIRSVGWVVSEDKKYVTIASCVDLGDNKFGVTKNVSTIVKSCITRRKTISI